MRSLCILVVDDDEESLRPLAKLLRVQRYTVRTATTLHAALRSIQEHPCDLLIADLSLPDGNGMDLVRELGDTHKGIPSIALTGHGGDDIVRDCLAAGFDRHLCKPLVFSELLDAIGDATAKSCTPAS